MNKYIVTMKKEFLILAKDQQEAEDKAVEECADDSEALMPHNMEIEVLNGDKYPDSFFETDGCVAQVGEEWCGELEYKGGYCAKHYEEFVTKD